jgi:epoxyqueuosine reductase
LSLDSSAAAIETAFHTTGLPVFSVMNQAGLEELARISDAASVDRYGLLQSSGAVVVAFPYDPRIKNDNAESGLESGAPPFVRIGAFAVWNRYAALSRLLLGAGRLLAAESGLPAKGFRAVVNSRLPEKRLAVMAGLGFIGRSGLVVTEAYGPACLLGALLLPPGFPVPATVAASTPSLDEAWFESALVPGSGCGACTECVQACPGAAIATNGAGFQLERCIQYWTTRAGEVPERLQAVWGERLYGCDDCVASCPRSRGAWSVDERGTSPAGRAEALFLPAERRPGRLISVPFLELASDDEIKAFFRKTALGLSWIRASELRRNARQSWASRSVGI